MPVTSPDNLYYPASTDQVAPLESILAAMESSVQTAFINRFKTVAQPVASAAARNALFPTPVALNQVYRTDLGQIERYNGSAWQAIAEVFTGGPTSSAVSIPQGGTLGVTGGVTVAAVPWARKISVSLHATTTSNSATYCDLVLRKDGTAVSSARLSNAVSTGYVSYAEILPANTSTTYIGVASPTGTSGQTTNFTNNGSLTNIQVETISL
jgi:hypothetical protein